ncbi:hypothetical protein KJ780_01275 [Candidatus Micrarchaeota archaeon]|nr:hypothetical protein [Candidatus Micrarchaeota archaeon]
MLEFLQNLVKMKKPESALLEQLGESIKKSAEQFGYSVSEKSYGLLVNGKESAAISIQFGGRKEFHQTMEELEKENVEYRVIITSSMVKSMSIGELKWRLANKYNTKNRWLIIDVEERGAPKTLNFMLYSLKEKEPAVKRPVQRPPRRKKIIGRRGEHKVQD